MFSSLSLSPSYPFILAHPHNFLFLPFLSSFSHPPLSIHFYPSSPSHPHTSFPVAAPMSRKRSTSSLISLAAFAFENRSMMVRVCWINSPSSEGKGDKCHHQCQLTTSWICIVSFPGSYPAFWSYIMWPKKNQHEESGWDQGYTLY